MIWCVNRAGADSPDPWTAALFGHARLFQGGIVNRLMEIDKVKFGDPDTAPSSGGSAVSLALLVLGAIAKAAEHPGPSIICVPDQRVADMLTA